MSELLNDKFSKGPAMELIQTALYADFLGTPAFFWVAFIAVVVGLLVLDLGVLHKGQKEIEARESLLLYCGYMAIAFEHVLNVNKAASALITGVLCWTIYAIGYDQLVPQAAALVAQWVALFLGLVCFLHCLWDKSNSEMLSNKWT